MRFLVETRNCWSLKHQNIFTNPYKQDQNLYFSRLRRVDADFECFYEYREALLLFEESFMTRDSAAFNCFANTRCFCSLFCYSQNYLWHEQIQFSIILRIQDGAWTVCGNVSRTVRARCRNTLLSFVCMRFPCRFSSNKHYIIISNDT